MNCVIFSGCPGHPMLWAMGNTCDQPAVRLVGGRPTHLKNDGVRQLELLFHSQYDGKVSQNSMVPVTTNRAFQEFVSH